MPAPADLRHLETSHWVTLGAAVVLTRLAGVAAAIGAGSVARFVVAGLALAARPPWSGRPSSRWASGWGRAPRACCSRPSATCRSCSWACSPCAPA